MSRITELKKQYPELNISIFDIITRIDKSGTYKYSPLICKILSYRWSDNFFDPQYDPEIKSGLNKLGISDDTLTNKSTRLLYYLFDFFNKSDIHTINEFIEYMDRGLINEKDISKYNNVGDLDAVLGIAKLKEISKSLESQIIKEYENDTWLMLRPLTFEASCKYGSSTRWCTTYKENPEHFYRYRNDGVLVYFINKKTGYKFAGFRGLHKNGELSFWSASDERRDFLQLELDDNIMPIVKKVMMSNETNRNLTPIEILEEQNIEYFAPIYRDDSITEMGNVLEEPRIVPIYENTISLNENYFIPARNYRKITILDRFMLFIRSQYKKIFTFN
jgi:hypothetical protein